MNKKGNMLLIVIFAAMLIMVLFLGFMAVASSAVINWVFDIAIPEVTDLGMVGDANMTEIVQITVVPLNNFIQSMVWFTGVMYVMVLIGSIAVPVVFKQKPSKWLIGFYFVLMFVVILTSIIISNTYEEFYEGDDPLATRMQEHVLLSWMVLYSPAVFAFIMALTGILLFSGITDEGTLV